MGYTFFKHDSNKVVKHEEVNSDNQYIFILFIFAIF